MYDPAEVERLSGLGVGDTVAGFDRAPARYLQGGREKIDVIRDALTDEGFVAFCIGSAIKYNGRDKGDPAGDADKGRWYREMAAHVRGEGLDPRHRRADFVPYVRPAAEPSAREILVLAAARRLFARRDEPRHRLRPDSYSAPSSTHMPSKSNTIRQFLADGHWESQMNTDYAKIAYQAYATFTGGKTHDGKDMPEWHELPKHIQNAWMAAAEAVIAVTAPGGFGWALARIQESKCVRRSGWNGKGMFLFLVQGSTFSPSVGRPQGVYGTCFDPEKMVRYLPHIDMKTADGSVVPWLCSQTDALAEDWEIAD
jgi:hypothetical protein